MQRNSVSTFLNYRENNLIYASYLSPFMILVLVEGAKYASNNNQSTVKIYITMAIFCIVVTIISGFLAYKLKIIKPYLVRKYLFILILIPSIIAYLGLSIMSFIVDKQISIQVFYAYIGLHFIAMFVIRFWILKKWIEFDQKRIPLQRGEKVYLGETAYQACNRFDWNS